MSLQVRNQTSGALERVAGFNDTDSILSPSSKNPISNKAVYNALLQKIDKTVTDLINYYDKSQTYSKPEVRALIGAINTLTIEVVSALPTQDISTTTIYFVGPAAGTNNYDEYVYVGGNWVQIGDTTIDLSNYVTSTNLTTVLQDYYTKSQADALFDDYYDKDTVDDLLDLKQNTLDFDNTPIAGSQNPVTSAGIKTALDNILITGNGGSIIKVHHLAGAAAAGNTVTASKGSYSVSSTFDVSGDAIIIGFGEIGHITITCSNGSETGTTYINIPSFSSYSTVISYGLDYVSWLIAGGIDPSYYESLDEVLEDEEVVRKLMTIHASVDYLASITNADDEMAITVLNNDICAKWINLRDYALDTLYANEYTKAIMDEANKYGYGEWALIGQVPKMASNTSPYGEVIFDRYDTRFSQPYYVFSGNIATTESHGWYSADSSTYSTSGVYTLPAYLGYHFTNSICVKSFRIRNRVYSAPTQIFGAYKFSIQGSNDGSSWVTIKSYEDENNTSGAYRTFSCSDNEDSYSYYRLYFIQGHSSQQLSTNVWISELQFYAWGPKGNVPVMTSNTAPYGTAIRKDIYSSTFEAFNAFNGTFNNPGGTNDYWHSNTTNSWVGYTFTNPICVKRFGIINYPNGSIKNYTIEASNDNFTNEVIVLKTGEFNAVSTVFWQYVDFQNDNYYLSYRIHPTTTYNGNGRQSVVEMQFYGREMKVSVPKMTSGTAPYGEASANDYYNSEYLPYLAFTDASGSWGSTTAQWIGYEFPKPVIIKKFYIKNHYYDTSYERGYIQAFVNNEWINISTEIYALGTNAFMFDVENTDNIQAKKIRFKINSCQYSTTVGTAFINRIQFYGFDYSERDWDTEHPMKYIYDHGVEIEEIGQSYNGSYSRGIIEKCGYEILMISPTGNSGYTGIHSNSAPYDFTPYVLERVTIGQYLENEKVGLQAWKNNNEDYSKATSFGYRTLQFNTSPYHNYFDISTINENACPQVFTGSNGIFRWSITEWWLE